jgi:hypothetical protein
MRVADSGSLVAVMLVAATNGCDPSRTSGTADVPLSFVITNNLLAPVSIAVDGVPAIGLNGGRSASLTVRSTAQWLTWTSAKPTDANGQPIPDDIGEVKIAVAGIDRALDISNVIGGRTYITARIFNHTAVAASIGIFDGTTTTCVSLLPAPTGPAAPFTQTGYYQLGPATEIRAFRDPVNCTGPWVAWGQADLRAYSAKSGSLILSLDTAP